MSGRGAVSLWGQPVTFESVETQEVESWQGLLHAFLHVQEYGAHANVTAVAADADGLLVTVRNDGLGNLSAGSLRLAMPSGAQAEAALPAIPAGGEATVRVPCEENGEHTLTVSWQKRLVAASNVGHHALPVTVAAAAGTGEAPAGGFLAVRSESVSQAAPGLVWGVPLALAAAALAVRRRAA
jgi:hypothetical protein